MTEKRSLISFLTGAGVGSRRHCFQLLISGKVLVNEEVALGSTVAVDPEIDQVMVDGRRVQAVNRKVYLKLNKPRGVISTTKDDLGRATIMNMVPPAFRGMRLFPVGRLDADTTGLLLLTNDGDLANRLTHPRFEVEKEYHVELDDVLTTPQKDALVSGVSINGQRTAPARVRRLPRREGATYSVTLHEGKKRQVRLMCVAVGRIVRSIQRVRIHNLGLDRLPLGQAAELSAEESRGLMKVFANAPKPNRNAKGKRL